MNEKKPKLLVAALENGTVIDHIPCDKVFTVTAIGDEALHTLKELGHCTLSFKGGDAAERPGCIMLQGDEPLTKDDIKVGTTIEIY